MKKKLKKLEMKQYKKSKLNQGGVTQKMMMKLVKNLNIYNLLLIIQMIIIIRNKIITKKILIQNKQIQ